MSTNHRADIQSSPQITNFDRPKSTVSTGFTVSILGTIVGILVIVFGVYLMSTVYGKGSSPLGIVALYGLMLLLFGILPFFIGLLV